MPSVVGVCAAEASLFAADAPSTLRGRITGAADYLRREIGW